MYFRDCKSLCCWKKNPINFLFRVQISPRSCIMDCFPPISFLNISDYRLQPRLFMGWWKDVSNCLYWLHISGSRIMNMLAFSLWHCCLIDITHIDYLVHCHTLWTFFTTFFINIMWKKYWNLNYIVFSLNYLVFSLNYIVFSLNYIVFSLNYLVFSLNYLVFSLFMTFFMFYVYT
jgi:hypothetical protein